MNQKDIIFLNMFVIGTISIIGMCLLYSLVRYILFKIKGENAIMFYESFTHDLFASFLICYTLFLMGYFTSIGINY